MAAVGLDAAFGKNGVATLPSGTFSTGKALSAGGAIFAKAGTGSQSYIMKLDAKGRLDASWGENGRVATTFFSASQLAYDAKTGSLYAGGVGASGEVQILRLTAAGQADPSFGSGGIASYAPPAAGGSISTGLTLHEVVPLNKGQVLVAFTRRNETTKGFYESDATVDLNVMRLRADGIRDVTFGRRGITTVHTGRTHGDGSDLYFYDELDVPIFGDVRPEADGGFRVVFSREYGTRSGNNGLNGTSHDTALQVKSRYVSGGGVIDVKQAHSWTLLPPANAESDEHRFIPLLVASDAGTDVTVIGNLAVGRNVYNTYAYALTPGHRPAATPFGTRGLVVNQVERSPFGLYYAADKDGTVARFRADFTLDRRFASRGVGQIGGTATLFTGGVAPDDHGGVLAVSHTAIERLI